MLSALIRLSLQYRFAVLLAAIILSVYGLWLLPQIPVDVFPNLNRPTVSILTEAKGLAPEEVETLVTLPLESVLNGTPGVLRVRSSSGIGISIIYVEFDWNTEIFRNRQLIAERLQLVAGQLPEGIQPVMGPISSIMGEIQFVGLTATEGTISPMELRTLAEWNIRPRLMTLPGISQIVVMGGEVKQYQILVSTRRLQSKGLSLEDLKHALGQISGNTTGGFIDIDEKEFLIRPMGRVSSVEEIEDSLIGMHFGQPVRVKDVADVRIQAKTKRGEGSINGRPAVVMTIQKQPDASTIDLTRAIDQELARIARGLPAGVRLEADLFKQSRFIESAIGNVEHALRDGILMVAVVLFLFLMNLRTTAITLTAIPLSLLVTVIVFHFFGLGINTMTLGGLAIAIGELVDDAIVDVENVFRRLRQNSADGSVKGYLRVIYEASREVRSSIVLSTAIVVLVFLPLFALGGIEGRLFAPLGIAYIVSILASLVVSLTVTPALCAYLLPASLAVREPKESRLVTRLKSFAARALEWTLPRPLLVLAGAGILVVGSVALFPFLGRDFLPEFNEGTATIGIAAAPGISLRASNALGTRIEEAILSVPEVKSTVRRTGRAEMDEHAEGVHWSEIDVDFYEHSKRKRETVLNAIRENIESTSADVAVNIGQPISHRLDHLLSGVRAQIAVKVFGSDLAELRRLGGEISDVMAAVPGLVDLQSEPLVLVPQLKIAIDREASSRFGLRSGTLAEDLETALNGAKVAQVIEAERRFDVFMRLDDESRSSPENIEQTIVRTTPTGSRVRLGEVANIYKGTGPNMVNREDMQRRIVVSANTSGRDLGGIVDDIVSRIEQGIEFPEGYFYKLGGQFESQRAASVRIFWLAGLALGATFLLLYLHFRSSVLSLLVMLNVPLALVGSLIAVFLTERTLSVATFVAFITLCGIATRNGILLLSHYLHLITEEGLPFSRATVIKGSLERLVPVLMTASTAALALIPLLLSKGEPGKEILYPVAVVIVGGLISSTLLDLLVTPTVFLNYGKTAVERFAKKHKDKDKGDWQ